MAEEIPEQLISFALPDYLDRMRADLKGDISTLRAEQASGLAALSTSNQSNREQINHVNAQVQELKNNQVTHREFQELTIRVGHLEETNAQVVRARTSRRDWVQYTINVLLALALIAVTAFTVL